MVAAETELRDLLAARVGTPSLGAVDVSILAAERGLDAGQEHAAAVVASTMPLVVVEGAAGAGKTTILGVAIAAAEQQGDCRLARKWFGAKEDESTSMIPQLDRRQLQFSTKMAQAIRRVGVTWCATPVA